MAAVVVAAAAVVRPGPVQVVVLVLAVWAITVHRSAYPGSSVGAAASAVGYPGMPVRTVAVAPTTSPGAPDLAAGLRVPVALAATPPAPGLGGIAVAVALAVREKFQSKTAVAAIAAEIVAIAAEIEAIVAEIAAPGPWPGATGARTEIFASCLGLNVRTSTESSVTQR